MKSVAAARKKAVNVTPVKPLDVILRQIKSELYNHYSSGFVGH
jgi:hypothetical protein